MTKKTETDAAGTLEHAYPKDKEPAPEKNTELETLKKSQEELQARVKELEDENSSLKKKLADVEHEKLTALAEQVASIKVSKGLLEEDKKAEELKELEKLSMETLTVLQKELTNVKVKLSEPPKPLSKPTNPPAGEPSAEEKKETEMQEVRLRLFGHKEPADEYFQKKRDEEVARRRF